MIQAFPGGREDMDTERSDSSESAEYAFPYVSTDDEGEDAVVADSEEDEELFDDDFENKEPTDEETEDVDDRQR